MSGVNQGAGEPRFNIKQFDDEQVFQMNREEATRIMLETHNHGVALCGVFSRPEAEDRV